jgi:hypothetical protein
MMRHFQITEFDTRAILVFGLSLIEWSELRHWRLLIQIRRIPLEMNRDS